MEIGIPWWVVVAGLIVFCALFAAFDAHRSKGNETATRTVIREELAAHNLELTAFREIIDSLPQEPVGTDGTVRARLPDGTNIVRQPSGKTHLAKPVRISGIGATPVYGRAAALTVTKKADDD